MERSPILKSIVDLAERYDALTMIDDAHATGFLGKTGRGTHEYRGVMGKIDIITGTLGKALGGASGGFTSGRKRDCRSVAAAIAPLPFFQHGCSADRGCAASKRSSC